MPTLPRVCVYIATSLDGFIAAEDGGLDWLERVQSPGEDYGYAAFMAGIDGVIVGRNTYDTMLGFPDWPFEGRRVVVLSHRAVAERQGVAAHSGALRPLLAALAADGIRRVYLDGGQTIRGALAEGLVDELTLSSVPVLLGRGRPLFGPEVPRSDWHTVSARAFPSGLVQHRLQRPANDR